MVNRDREWDWLDDSDYNDDWTDSKPKNEPNGGLVED